MGTSDGLTSIELDGRTVFVRVDGADGLPAVPGQGKYTDTGRLSERVALQVAGLDDLIRGVAGSVRSATDGLEPQEVSVAFGIELTVKSGKVVSLLADGEGKAALTITLTWRPDEPADGRAGRAVEGRAVDGRAVDGRAVDGRAADGRAAEGRAVDGRAADGRAAEGRGTGGERGEGARA
ncbi:CU044_2847 family protein [Streptomyces sp. NPDC101118]|uniref:CU044_2847 family protein n=1 Tax=Streptomyces sp. NPDC101118 TaxID=3366109 RepID=UPI003807D5A5